MKKIKDYLKSIYADDFSIIKDKDNKFIYYFISIGNYTSIDITLKKGEEKQINKELLILCKSFDFSFYLCFDSLKELKTFNKCSN